MLFMYALGLAGIELTFLIAALLVLCLLVVARTVLITCLAATQGQPTTKAIVPHPSIMCRGGQDTPCKVPPLH